MINKEYTIDYSGWCDSGGCCQVYSIANNTSLVFKEFRSKNKAISSLRLQKKLAKYDLAPKILSLVSRLYFAPDDGLEDNTLSDWGYITEKAKVTEKVPLSFIQSLVDEIYDKTGLSFWDCHYYNVGFINRKNSKKLVCIDTGKESFLRDSNAWGFGFPGPKCNYCYKYQCECCED